MIKIILLITVVGLVQCGPQKLGTSRVPRDKRMTFPGTKWCGPGNSAKDYSDLGSGWGVDQCCREHDHCPDFIMPHERKHGLSNRSSYVRMSCNCDMKFYQCLKDTKTLRGYFVGKLYFNINSAFCFKKDYEKSDRPTNRDDSRPQVNQWFLMPSY